jgi:hypothetical protein
MQARAGCSCYVPAAASCLQLLRACSCYVPAAATCLQLLRAYSGTVGVLAFLVLCAWLAPQLMNVAVRCKEAPILVVGTHADLVGGGSVHLPSLTALQDQFPQVPVCVLVPPLLHAVVCRERSVVSRLVQCFPCCSMRQSFSLQRSACNARVQNVRAVFCFVPFSWS